MGSKIKWISEAHSDVVGILFGLLVSAAAILVILMAAGVVRVPCRAGTASGPRNCPVPHNKHSGTMDSPENHPPAKDGKDDRAACHALQLRALDACVVSETPDCARVLELYRARGCGAHERFVDFLPPPSP